MSSTSDDQGDESFVIEEILSSRSHHQGFTEYLVKWENYDNDSNSWEPEHNFNDEDYLKEWHIKHPEKYCPTKWRHLVKKDFPEGHILKKDRRAIIRSRGESTPETTSETSEEILEPEDEEWKDNNQKKGKKKAVENVVKEKRSRGRPRNNSKNTDTNLEARKAQAPQKSEASGPSSRPSTSTLVENDQQAVSHPAVCNINSFSSQIRAAGFKPQW
jgi:hypothetical protein